MPHKMETIIEQLRTAPQYSTADRAEIEGAISIFEDEHTSRYIKGEQSEFLREIWKRWYRPNYCNSYRKG